MLLNMFVDTQEVIMYHAKFINFCAAAFMLKLMVLGAVIIPTISQSSASQEIRLKGDKECAICMSSARDLGNDQARFTQCCKQFICAKDADEIGKKIRESNRDRDRKRQLEIRCPYCRHTPFQVTRPTAEAPAARDLPTPSAPRLEARPRVQPRANAQKNNRQRQLNNSAQADQQLQQWLSQQPNAKKCPTPGCSYAFINELTRVATIICMQCQQEYCSDCLAQHSIHVTCNQARANRNQQNNDYQIALREQNRSARSNNRYRARRYTLADYLTELIHYSYE